MKHTFVFALSLIALNANAGGGPSGPTTRCGPDTVRVLRESSVLDRGGNRVAYRIKMTAARCERLAEVFTVQRLYINYDAPKLRQEQDGRLIGDTIVWSGKQFGIYQHPHARLHDSTVTESGITMQIGDSRTPGEDTQTVPDSLKADNATVIEVLGNAFPTHTIVGPFDR